MATSSGRGVGASLTITADSIQNVTAPNPNQKPIVWISSTVKARKRSLIHLVISVPSNSAHRSQPAIYVRHPLNGPT